jgi:DNA-binding NtrC family response regulator
MPSTAVITAPTVPYRALVVDDEAAICALLAAQLTAAGWEAVMATRMSEAKIAIADRTRTLDLVFVDLKLPDGSGMDLLPLIEDRRDRPDVVIVTGYRDEESLLHALRAGVVDFLHKPIESGDIARVLRSRAVRERRRLGLTFDRFERVDQEFAAVHRELADIRDILQGLSEQPVRAHGSQA